MTAHLIDPLVSVIIPVHNRATCLRDAVASVREQGISVEIIFVDDASSDNSAEVIRLLTESYPGIRAVYLEKNRGGGHARNVGIELAQGRWIAFLDSDDVWLPGKLKAQLAVLMSKQENAPLLCFTNLVIDTNDGKPAKQWNTEPYANDDSIKDFMLRQGQVVQTSTIVMCAGLAKRVRFDDRLRRHQDIDFVLRCELAGARFHYIDQNLVRYSADPAAVRVSRLVNAEPSLKWLEVARDYLSEHERDGFYLKHVFDIHFKESRSAALRMGWLAVHRGVEPKVAFATRVIRQMIPTPIKRLRNAIRNR